MKADVTRATVLFTLAVLWVGCASGAASHADGATDSSPSDDLGAGGAGGQTAGDGGDRAGAGGQTPDGDVDHGAADEAERLDGAPGALFGTVAVGLITDESTSFVATFFDAPTLPTPLVDPTQELGGCTLLIPRATACTPVCASDATCTGVDQCMPKPHRLSVGVLRVQGLGGRALSLEPPVPTEPTYQVVPTLPYPACLEGDDVAVEADAFSISGKCVAPLVVTTAAPIPVLSGQATHLTWTPPGRAGISRIQIALEISHHGGFRGELDCDVADTGAFDIPEPLVTALVKLGRAGYPTIKLARASTATAATQPHVALVVSSSVELDADTGVVSCGTVGSPPCPGVTNCQTDHTCQ